MGSTYLLPLQLGYGIPRDAEAIVNSVGSFLHHSESSHCILKLDFQNAFNSLRRDQMLQAISDVVTVQYPFVHAVYGRPSSLFHGETTILSQEGVQQGDPLGPMLFCLTIHPMLKYLKSELRAFYLNDGTLGGTSSDIIQDQESIENIGRAMGLQLSRSKTQLISKDR